MSANLEQIAENLSALTVMEAAELSKMLEEKWGVSAAAPVDPSRKGFSAGSSALTPTLISPFCGTYLWSQDTG